MKEHEKLVWAATYAIEYTRLRESGHDSHGSAYRAATSASVAMRSVRSLTSSSLNHTTYAKEDLTEFKKE